MLCKLKVDTDAFCLKITAEDNLHVRFCPKLFAHTNPLTVHTGLRRKCGYYPHFIDAETETQRLGNMLYVHSTNDGRTRT